MRNPEGSTEMMKLADGGAEVESKGIWREPHVWERDDIGEALESLEGIVRCEAILDAHLFMMDVETGRDVYYP